LGKFDLESEKIVQSLTVDSGSVINEDTGSTVIHDEDTGSTVMSGRKVIKE
jgi:hypothetical protein